MRGDGIPTTYDEAVTKLIRHAAELRAMARKEAGL
jgi:hypothetical protein